MKHKEAILTALTFLFIQFTINGCSDDQNQAVNPQSPITVSGKAVNSVNQGVPYIKVKSANQTAITSSDGNFSISGVYTPYDLEIVDSGFTTTQNYFKFYYGLSTNNIIIPETGFADDSIHCNISVNYPPEILLPGVEGKIMFTDGNYVNSYGIFPQNPFKVTLTTNSATTGKLILLTYKKDVTGKIISYENFGESSPLQVIPGGNYNYTFSLQEVSLNPGEKHISGSITNVQPGFSNEFKYFFLTFSSKKTPNHSNFSYFEALTKNTFDIILPDNLPIQYSPMLFSYSDNGQQFNEELYKLPQGSGVNLETKSSPELLTPPDNATNVDRTTLFSFTPGTGDGIYMVLLFKSGGNNIYSAYINGNSFRLEDFKSIFPEDLENSTFTWSVQKIGYNNSLNDYLTTYTDHPEYFKNNSLRRNFSTAP